MRFNLDDKEWANMEPMQPGGERTTKIHALVADRGTPYFVHRQPIS